jgi:dihydroneopterin aldolase
MTTLPVELMVPTPPGTRRFVNMLEAMELSLFLGIHPGEREAPQRVRITVHLVCDYRDAPFADDITNVVDYDFLRDGIHRLAAEQRFDLQETLCESIVALCWRFTAVTGVCVETMKPDIYPDAAIGCRIVRVRPA